MTSAPDPSSVGVILGVTHLSNDNPSIVLGVTHLLVDGELTPLLKCPFCNFQNIHEDTITHHIKFTNDSQHKVVDIEQLDKGHYIVTRVAKKESPYGPYLSKAEIKLPWIRCLWCNYRDKIDFDLSLHFLEQHKKKLLAIPITIRERKAAKILAGDWFAIFEGPMEYRLDKSVDMEKNQGQAHGHV